MFCKTTYVRGFFSRGGRTDVSKMLDRHFWSLTHYRIGYHLFALDYAGNIIFYPAYRKKSFGGWTAVTLGAPGTPSFNFVGSDMRSMNVLEDGHPMHYRARQKLQDFVAQERRRWEMQCTKKDAERNAASSSAGQGRKSETDVGSNGSNGVYTSAAAATKEGVVAARDKLGAEVTDEALTDTYDRQQQFRDLLAIKCSHPRFFVRHLCISRLATFVYKCLYFYLWVVLLSLVVQGYLLFRSWVNPPARVGLKNLEERLLHVPRLLFAGCVYGVAWLVRAAQPVIDPVVNFLNKNFPQINWGAALAERLATKAEHFADDTHPKMKILRQQELQQQKNDEERRGWIGRILLALFALFSLLCVL